LVEALHHIPEGCGMDFFMISLKIFIGIILPVAIYS